MKRLLVLVIISFLLCSCFSKSEKKESGDHQHNSNQKAKSNDSQVIIEYPSDCKIEDGTYPASVTCNNSRTGYLATYKLNVDVQGCQVVRINFPKDGNQKEDDFAYAEISEDGYALVNGEDGRTYEIQLDR